jgi:Icc-related predicted phosphoesterase
MDHGATLGRARPNQWRQQRVGPELPPDGQLALPDDGAAGADPGNLASWPGWRLSAEADWLSRLPLLVAIATGAFLTRWILRIGLPMVAIAAVLHSFPYHATVQHVPFRVEGTIVARPGLSAETTFGNWEFPAVDGLPFGVHVTPENVDLLQLARSATPDTAAYAKSLQDGLIAQRPAVVGWLLGEILIGLVIGLGGSAAINMAIGYLRGRPRRPDELMHRTRQFGFALLVTAGVAVFGVVTYNPNWVRQSKLTGTLAAAQLFPNQLSAYYQQQNKAFDVLGSIVGIQAALQDQIDQDQTPDTALRIMHISDMHLAANYPLVAEYAKNYDVKLIVNTGDESEFGTSAELTPEYLAAIRAVTKVTPMLWLAGNHDSPQVENVMRHIPGVTVLGQKTATAKGYSVSAGIVHAFGLTIAGVPDPRVYGGVGAYGSNDGPVTDPLERSAVDGAVQTIRNTKQTVDIFATHEPVAAAELRKQLPDRIRQTNAGHLHEQNKSADVQHGSSIDLVEGSTGAGGLDNIVRGAAAPPIEFSIESVAPDCQFTRVLRFQITSPQPTSETAPQAYGDDVTVSTVYFRPQDVATGRVCGADLPITAEEPLE